MYCFVYILKCNDNSLYTGITTNPRRRVNEHNKRIKSCLQKCKIPAKLVYLEKCNNRKEAAKREKEIKGWTRDKKLKLVNSLH